MKKGQKIKRYNSIYSSKKPNATAFLHIIFMLCGLALFAYVGWSLYPLVSDYFEEDASAPSATAVDLPKVQETEKNPAPASEMIPKNDPEMQSTAITGLYYPPKEQSNVSLEQFLEFAKKENASAVIIDAKDATGKVLYQSQNSTVQKVGALTGDPYNAKDIAAKIAEAGMTPVARIHAFRDNIAPHVNRNMAVKYRDTDILWLDNSADQGGRAWLNPYSKEAKDYIVEIAVELTQMGFYQIILDSVQFPSGYSLELAGYGQNASIERVDALKIFMQEIVSAVSMAGGEVMLYVSAVQVSDGFVLSPFEINGFEMAGKRYILGITPLSMTSGITFAGKTYSNPATERANLIEAVMKAAKLKKQDSEIITLLSAYGPDGTVLPLSELLSMKEAALRSGAIGTILYEPQGNYPINE